MGVRKPMPNQVLIVAGENAARTPAEVARSLRFTPVVTGSEEEAVASSINIASA